ncbi:hypothetical protein EON68_01115, partial [archaeon]
CTPAHAGEAQNVLPPTAHAPAPPAPAPPAPAPPAALPLHAHTRIHVAVCAYAYLQRLYNITTRARTARVRAACCFRAKFLFSCAHVPAHARTRTRARWGPSPVRRPAAAHHGLPKPAA